MEARERKFELALERARERPVHPDVPKRLALQESWRSGELGDAEYSVALEAIKRDKKASY